MIPINDRVYLFLKSLFLGFLIVGFLVFKGNVERLFIIALTLTIIIILRSTKFKINYTVFLLLGLISGYILGNIILYCSVYNLNKGLHHQKNNIEHEDKLPKPAVIILYSGEPDVFDLTVILKNIYSDKSIIKKIIAPIEVFKFKLAYENVGSSKTIDLCNRIRDDLKIRLGIDYDVYLSYFNIEPLIYEEIERLSKQYEKLIIAPLILSESEEYKELKKVIEERYLGNDIIVEITPLLWRSQKLSKQIFTRSIEGIGKEDINSGGIILLISEGNSFYEQSIFCNDIINRMEKFKFDRDKIICLKYHGNEKLLLKSIERIKRKGASKILIISISRLEDNIRKQNEILRLIKKINDRNYVNIKYLNGWGIDENLLNELEYRIRITNLKN